VHHQVLYHMGSTNNIHALRLRIAPYGSKQGTRRTAAAGSTVLSGRDESPRKGLRPVAPRATFWFCLRIHGGKHVQEV
jgi:hypothetical protein